MRNFYFLITTALFSMAVTAQEFIPNGGFETWTEGTPDSWTVSIPDNGGSVEQSTDFHSGASSALVTAPMGTGNVRLSLTDFEITPGEEYTFSYWYKDESVDARARHWASWRDSDGGQLEADLDILQPQEYNLDTNGWQEVTFTVTAPANAAKFRLEFRTYREGDTGGGQINFDDVSFTGSDMSVNDLNSNNVSMTTVWNDQATFSAKGNATVEIINLNGQLVQKTTGINNFNVNVSALTKGVYIVRITVDGKTTTQKVIKK